MSIPLTICLPAEPLSLVEEAVERLQKYRTALITAAITGKIDVRKEAVP